MKLVIAMHTRFKRPAADNPHPAENQIKATHQATSGTSGTFANNASSRGPRIVGRPLWKWHTKARSEGA